MNILKALRKEEARVQAVFGNAEMKLNQIRAAIKALSSTNGQKPLHRKHALKGRHLSKAHRDAIKAGWAKRLRAAA